MTDKGPDSAVDLISNLGAQLCVKYNISRFFHVSNYEKLL